MSGKGALFVFSFFPFVIRSFTCLSEGIMFTLVGGSDLHQRRKFLINIMQYTSYQSLCKSCFARLFVALSPSDVLNLAFFFRSNILFDEKGKNRLFMTVLCTAKNVGYFLQNVVLSKYIFEEFPLK